MQYVLGNMLNGGGGLNADSLSLDLQFAADKTMTARKGPTPVFTRASSATFVGSNGLIQSAAINTPRFDHTSAGVCRGLLIEESRTNSILQSENFGTTWAAGGCAVSVNTDVAPDGNTTADSVNITNAGGHFLVQNIAASASTAYTFSFWVKRGTATALSYSIFNNTAGSNIVAPTSYYNQTSSAWSRVSFTFTTPVGCTSIAVYILRDGGSTGTVLLWGAQLEAGSFATSYIPTTTGTVVRSADVCSITGGDFTSFYNQSEGTMLTNAFTPASGDRTVLAADDNTTNEMIRLRTEGTNPFFKVTDGGSEVVAIDAGTVTANIAFKLIGAYKVNDFASSINGGSAVTDTTGTIPTVDRMRIGAGQSGNTMCGCVASLRYYKKRLPNAKLQALTA
jgi:hypothetical protein